MFLMLKDLPVLKLCEDGRCEILDFCRLPFGLRIPASRILEALKIPHFCYELSGEKEIGEYLSGERRQWQDVRKRCEILGGE